MHTEIYLDSNATTPVWSIAAQAALRTMQDAYGNPSSSHSAGLRAREQMDAARASARRVLGAGAGQVLFTSGATEAIQTAVLSALCAVRDRRAHGETTGSLLVYGATEHKAVPESLAHWNTVLGLGLVLRVLPVDGEGRHDLAQLRMLAPQAALVCTMAANNETGAVSDLQGIEAVMRNEGAAAAWLVDCVQALGKLSLALSETRIDYAAFSGHKLHAPKGIGMLYVREGAPVTPLMAGGGQEAGQRAGTENTAGIVALGAVLAAVAGGGVFRTAQQMAAWRDRLAEALQGAFPGIVFNTPLAHALPTTLNFSVQGRTSQELLNVFDAAGVRVSAGSACSAARAAPSYVLQAMGLAEWRAASAVRMSFDPLADEAFITEACHRIAAIGAALHAAGEVRHDTAAAQGDIPLPAEGEAPAEATWSVQPDALPALLRQHPDALLVDVREPAEYLASPTYTLGGCSPTNLPLSRLPERLQGLLDDPGRTLVFVCRSGARSERAARCLRNSGHARAWTLSGGLALAMA